LEQSDIDKIEKIERDFMMVHDTFTGMKSEPYDLFLKFMNVTMKDGSVSKMYKELIAVGISVFFNCEPCTAWHVREAMKSGATDKQIMETIEVAGEMGGGPVFARCSFAMKLVEYLKDKLK
jgi:AhpD family alkylhydroperoxidase